jgi:pSer/pThr/pTyr-binding forkhead associated (FHA) protein
MPIETPPLSMVVNNSDVPPAVLTLPSGQRIELHEGHYVLGRHLESDIVLNDSNVSRKHAEFVCAAGEVVVRDLGSTNGTKVNGVSVLGDQLLQHGDVINFGTAQVRFEAT